MAEDPMGIIWTYGDFCFYFDFHLEVPLREKCPNIEFFLVRIFQHSDWIRRDTTYFSGKIRTRKNSVFGHFSFGGTGSSGRGLSLFLSSTSIRPRKIRHWLIVLHLKWLSCILDHSTYDLQLLNMIYYPLGFRIWLNTNSIKVVDVKLHLNTVISHRHEVDLNSHRIPS